MTVVLKRFDNTDTLYPLGRHVQHDERSWAYALLPKYARPLNRTTHWRSPFRVHNQEIGSCTGNALGQWGNTNFAKPMRVKYRNGHPFREADALEIYSLATHLDDFPGEYPPDDTGSSGLGAVKAGIRLGFISTYSWVFSWTSLLAAIERTPLLAGTVWTNKMFVPVNGLVSVGSLSDSNIAGAHAYLMCGTDPKAHIDNQDGVLEFRNSWGDVDDWPGCKPGGYFAVTFKDFQRLQDMQGDFTIPHMRSGIYQGAS